MKHLITLILLLPTYLLAEHTVINNYFDARDNYFYNRLYLGEVGESLYCGISRPIDVGGGRSLEHIYPADRIAKIYRCSDRDHCDNPTYLHAVGDLHNLWLAVKNINSSRGDNWYGEVEGERNFDYCQKYERTYSPDEVFIERVIQ